ncbi:MAG: fimbrillin family protein [Bacteroidales bacterium]|nr:fimbrillin family protein [Bacteroidales bacterium]
MKTSRLIMTVLAVLAFASCKNDYKETAVKPGDAVTVNFLAGAPASRTAFAAQNASGYYPVRWTDSDAVAVSLNADGWQTLAAVPSGNKTTATFSGSFTAAENYKFYAVSPAASVKDLNASRKAWLLNIPWLQTPGVSTPDPKAIIIGASTSETATLPDPVSFMFSHLTAYLRLTLENVPSLVGTVASIDLTCSVPFAGDWYYSLADGSFSSREASRSVRLVTTSVSDQWIACAPVDMSEKKLTVTVTGSAGSVSRTVTLPKGRQYASGMVSELTVDMTSASPVQVSAGEAAFLDTTVPGFYPKTGSSFTYKAGQAQLSRSYTDGKVRFGIVASDGTSAAEFSGIPETAVVGNNFTLVYRTVSSLGGDSASYNVAVVKEDGALLWLQTSAGDGFIVKK